MVRELLNQESNVVRTRKVGSSREGDGGRDIEIEIIQPELLTRENIGLTKPIKVIGQCKAYKNSVNKSNVKDIRDTLDFYNSQGYFLAVSSQITVPLHDYLNSLKEKYNLYVDWWNKSEIEDRLRIHTDIALRYPDIVTIM